MYAFGISLLVAATTTLQSPHLSVKVLHDNALQLLCDAIDAETDVIRFYRNTTLEGFVSIFKVTRNKQCAVQTNLTADTAQCKCIDIYKVVCNITDITLSRNDQWKCAVLENNRIQFSNDARVSTETFSTMAAKAPFSAISSKTDSHVNTSPHIATEEGTTQKSSVEEIPEISTALAITNAITATDMAFDRNTTKINSNVVAIMATAGPFIVLDIGLLLFVCRKKLNICQKRKTCNGT
ncbi:uncharacterized protein LOC127831393 [Dreissena polymorpha]|uniref:uncharacterized protein LOC127831393 n=1 Tax=Dreissena polymorpha TaxID=45954 RepID=UPI0022655C8D|nr:uncharacterized protein LOC127831393 [Dreissena polymorpha]